MWIPDVQLFHHLPLPMNDPIVVHRLMLENQHDHLWHAAYWFMGLHSTNDVSTISRKHWGFFGYEFYGEAPDALSQPLVQCCEALAPHLGLKTGRCLVDNCLLSFLFCQEWSRLGCGSKGSGWRICWYMLQITHSVTCFQCLDTFWTNTLLS